MNETKEVKAVKAADDEKEKMSPIKRRELIKTIIIIFLAVMLVLTFFSNTIMNKSLAEISTETATGGKLTERISERGVVEANQAYNVTIEDNRVIEKIHIKLGQEVKKDDVLFTVNTVDNEKLEMEEATLDSLKLEYETALLKDPVDYSSENQDIRIAREELNQLIAKRDAARVNDSNAAYAKSEYNSNKAELAKLTATQEKLQTAVKCISSDSYEEAPYDYIGELPALYAVYAAAADDYNNAYETYQKAVESGANVELAKADADEKEAKRDDAYAAYSDAKSALRSELVSQLGDIEGSAADLSAKVENYLAQYGEGGAETYEALAADVVSKQNELESLIIALEKAKKSDNISDRKEALGLESKKKALDKQQEKVEKMKSEAKSTEIKSKYSGVVTALNVQPDASVAAGDTLAVIDLVDEGFTVKISVEADKAKKVKKGTEAEILNNYGGAIQAVLTEIKNDPAAGSKMKQLVFSVTGDVDSNDQIDISIPCGSGTYEAIVPRSAVHKGENGDYVYTVRSKSTPLGNRYYVEKVNVNVEAKDEVSCAVSGGISRGDYVITAASKPISAGDQVRMKDK